MLAKKTYKNQVTIPKEMIRGLEEIEYFDVKRKGAQIVLEPVKVTPVEENLERVREKIEKLGITEKDIEEAVRWARRKRD